MGERRAYRIVGEERIDGTWRHVFINNGGTYYLTDLVVYADGVIQCGWEPLSLDELRAKLDSGWITVTPHDGASGSAFSLASWRFAATRTWISRGDLLAEIADEIERLAGRPTASHRCYEAVQALRREPTETNRAALRAAYLAVPSHRRVYLGDMDAKDWPYRALATPVGEPLIDDDEPVTAEDHQDALQYFAEQERGAAQARERAHADGPEAPVDRTVELNVTMMRWPEPPSRHVLRAEYPALVEYAGRRYPTVEHAYWALAVRDPATHDAVLAAASPSQAQEIAVAAPLRDGWEAGREAVMTALHRAKFRQHPQLLAALLATGDGRIVYRGAGSAFFGARNRMGRLLEQVRAEFAAERAGLPVVP
ncbi:NADAR family protein [Streptomyces sp. PR69]|uniref:NADAR family protein n=1 Tax=Streptomyces sp. PR69 TaxID=2984950 RepID=UPI0022642E32|nr:NADAR family protein [Streptomyces sp. PR69]